MIGFPLRLIAHRGASAYAPENTEAAVRLGLEQGCTAVECDLQLSADRVPIVVHDPDLQRVGGDDTPVAQREAAEVVGHPVRIEGRSGEPAVVPTLEQWLEWIPEDRLAVIELKEQSSDRGNEDLVQATVDIVRSRRQPLALISFHLEIVQQLRDSLPHLCIGPIRNRPLDRDVLTGLRGAAQGCVVLKKTVLDLKTIQSIRGDGHEVWSYALDTEREVLDARAVGVNGVITNTPDVARQATS